MSRQDESIAHVWDRALAQIEDSPDVTPRQLAFVKLAKPLGLLDGTVLLAVRNDLTKDYLESRVRGEVNAALSHALGREARFAITVDPDLETPTPEPVTLRPPVPDNGNGNGSGATPSASDRAPVPAI